MDWTILFKIFTELLPVAIKGVHLISQEQGKPIDQAIADVVDHLTPGAPNSAALSG